MTKQQLTDVADNFVKNNRRLPKPKELAELVGDGYTSKQAQGFLMQYKKNHVKQLNVINGKVYDPDGGTIWFQSTAGSMMPAAFYEDPGLGKFISQ